MSYKAIVTRIRTRNHPNANKLKLGNCFGFQVVVSIDTKDDELGVFFNTDGQLSEEMCKANDLIARKNPETGEHEGGFFSEKRRVQAQKFRGEKSDGYWTPLSAFIWTGADLSRLKEGDEFDTLNSHPICNKYYTPATLRAMRSGQKNVKRGETIFFRKHPDTPQFKRVASGIPFPSLIWFSEKQHGTSMRMGYVRDGVTLSWWKQWINKFYPIFPDQEYIYLNGSRNVILEYNGGKDGYFDSDFRFKIVRGLSLHKGECLYGEITGFIEGDTPIMGCQPIHDKELKKIYGDLMTYTYGCQPGECKLFIYRITHSNHDGIPTELTWQQMVARCNELGLKTVSLLQNPYLYTGNLSELEEIVSRHTEGSSVEDTRHIREGVVLRVESAQGIHFIKNKSHNFLVLEGIIKDKEDHIDLEEVS